MFGQSEDTIPLRADRDSIVGIPIKTIRAANVKLLERNFFIDICNIQEQTINDYKSLVENQKLELFNYNTKLDSLSIVIANSQELNNKLAVKSKERLCYCIGFGGITIGLIIALLYGK